MTNYDTGNYQPDLAVPPGETVKEAMAARGMNQAELADRLKKTKQEMTAIISGKQEISPDVALRLETVMGIPASFWLSLQSQYNETLARIQSRKALKDEAAEAARFPYAHMARLGWVPKTGIKTEQAENLLSFFAVTRLSQVARFHKVAYTMQYRRSAKCQANPDHLAAWLRKGEIEANRIPTPSFDKNALRNALASIRALTPCPPCEAGEKLRAICRDCGVVIVYLPHIPKTHVNGATLWLRSEGSAAKDKPVVILSDRYKWADIFWFTVFHEIHHVLAEKRNQVFVELPDTESDEDEQKADRFAADVLIPPRDYNRLPKHALLSAHEARKFAAEMDIHAGVLVGRLQHDGIIPRQNLNALRVQYNIGKED